MKLPVKFGSNDVCRQQMAALSEAKELLLGGKELLDKDFEFPSTLLNELKVKELKLLTKEVHLIGSS